MNRAVQLSSLQLSIGDFIRIRNHGFDPQQEKIRLNTQFHLLIYAPYKAAHHNKQKFRGRRLVPCAESDGLYYLSDFHRSDRVGDKKDNHTAINWQSDHCKGIPVEVETINGQTEKTADHRYRILTPLPCSPPQIRENHSDLSPSRSYSPAAPLDQPTLRTLEIPLFNSPPRDTANPFARSPPHAPSNPLETTPPTYAPPAPTSLGSAVKGSPTEKKLHALKLVKAHGGGQDVSIPTSLTQTEVDVGLVNYVTKPQLNIDYIFSKDNPNRRYMLWANTRTSKSNQGKRRSTDQILWDKRQCSGCIQCSNQQCQVIRRPKSSTEAIFAQVSEACEMCGSELVWVQCGAIFLSKERDGCVVLTMEGPHTLHETPPEFTIPRTAQANLFVQGRGVGPKTHLVRTGLYDRFPALLEPGRSSEFTKSFQNALFPSGLGIEGVPCFNKQTGATFVRGNPEISHIDCATDFQVHVVEVVVEKHGKVLWNGKELWFLWFHCDITFNQCDTHVKFVISMFDPVMGLTMKVFECWIQKKDTSAQAQCFEAFFNVNPALYDAATGELKFAGFCMDFDVAESNAAGMAYARLQRRVTGKGQQAPIGLNPVDDKKNQNSKEAATFRKNCLKGDKFHACQSIMRILKSPYALPVSQRSVFKECTNLMLETSSVDEFDNAVRRIKSLQASKVSLWLNWWLSKDTPGKIFPSQMTSELQGKNPPNTSLSEPINSAEQRCATGRYLPIVTAIYNSYDYNRHYEALYNAKAGSKRKSKSSKKKSPAHRRNPRSTNVPPDLATDLARPARLSGATKGRKKR